MNVPFVIGLGVWMIGHGVPGPASTIMFIVGGVLVIVSAFMSL